MSSRCPALNCRIHSLNQTLYRRHSSTQTMSYALYPRGNSLIPSNASNVLKLLNSHFTTFSTSDTGIVRLQADASLVTSLLGFTHNTMFTAVIFATRSLAVSSRSGQALLVSDSTVSSDRGSSVLRGRFTASGSTVSPVPTISCSIRFLHSSDCALLFSQLGQPRVVLYFS